MPVRRSPPLPRAERRDVAAWLPGAALAALVVAVYAPTLGNGYVSDDEIYIRGIRELASAAGLRDIWLRIGAVPQYYPLVHTAFWLEYRLWGLDPVGFHAMNVAAHAAVVLLAWRLLVRLALPGAWLGAALFAVHPVQVETVAWASERKNLLSAAFALASMLAYLRFAPLDPAIAGTASGGRRRHYALSLALFAAALLCKTVAIAAAPALLVLRWWKTGALGWRDVRPLLPFLALGLPLALLTIRVEREHVGAVGAAWELGLLERVLIAGRAVWFYLGKLAWPHPLGFVYPRWNVDAGATWQYAYPAALAALALALLAARGRLGRGPLAALLLFVGVLFPALGFFDVYPFLFSFVADHYQYHASLAPLAFAASAFVLGARAGRVGRGVAWTAALAAIAVLGLLAQRESTFYRDDATLIRRSAENQPDSWAARYRLGFVLQNEGRRVEALEEMREALRLFPSHAPIQVAIALNLAALGRLDEASAAFESALSGALDDDDRATTLLHLGNLRVAQRRVEDAAAHFGAATALTPGSAEAHYSLGLALRGLGQGPGALAALRRSVELDPRVAKSQYALGLVLLDGGDAAGALEPLRTAVELAPENAAFRGSLAAAVARAGQDDEESEP